ncbi:MAG: hypothetical protein KDD52_03230 [Bdellovibrionales bacterium]|nr:hypothetical protein [Bdellovibrionales bacterium]
MPYAKKTKYRFGRMFAALLIAVFSQKAAAQIAAHAGNIKSNHQVHKEEKIHTDEGWFDIVDSEGNFIVELHTKEGSLSYGVCTKHCSQQISVQAINTYKRGSQLYGREILFKKSDGQGGEYILLSLYKDRDGQSFSDTLGRRSTWSVKQINGAFTFDFDNKNKTAYLKILSYERKEMKELEKDKGWFQVMDADGNHIVELNQRSLGYVICNRYIYRNCSAKFRVEARDSTSYDQEKKSDFIVGRIITVKDSKTGRILLTYIKEETEESIENQGIQDWMDHIIGSISLETKDNGLGAYILVH